MTRGVFDGLAVRGIELSRLGIPPVPPSAATRGSSGKSSRFVTRPSAPNEGSLVEFFAVDSSREAIERSFDEFDRPMIGTGSDRRVGVFTYFLYRALTDSSGRVATYRDLAHHVVREMQRSQIAPPAMPTFGGALDRPLLSIGKAPPPAAWQVTLSGNTVEIPGRRAARPDREVRPQALGLSRAGRPAVGAGDGEPRRSDQRGRRDRRPDTAVTAASIVGAPRIARRLVRTQSGRATAARP